MLGLISLAALGAYYAALHASHMFADHWVQTQAQSNDKGEAGWLGRRACAGHVATYTATQAVAVVAVYLLGDLHTHPAGLVAGLLVSAATHYIADRRTPLRRVADWLGKDPGWLERGGGLYALDQSWHTLCLLIAALLMAVRL